MKIKAIAACGNGMGSSQMIKMKINKVFKRLGIDAEIGHMSVGEAKGVANNYDMIFVSETFTSRPSSQHPTGCKETSGFPCYQDGKRNRSKDQRSIRYACRINRGEIDVRYQKKAIRDI